MSEVEEPEHPVGYANPPKHARFIKGRSGNPKGRAKGSRNLASVLLASANEKVSVKENGRHRSITKLEASLKQLVNKAAGGDPKATQMLVQLVRVVDDKSGSTAPELAIEEADELVIETLFQRVKTMILTEGNQ